MAIRRRFVDRKGRPCLPINLRGNTTSPDHSNSPASREAVKAVFRLIEAHYNFIRHRIGEKLSETPYVPGQPTRASEILSTSHLYTLFFNP